MSRRRLRHVSLTMAVLLGAATPAAGADQTIGVGTIGPNEKSFGPSAVTINPGDTVTWQWVGPSGDLDHIVASSPGSPEVFDSDSGVSPGNENHSIGDTFPHTFPTAGTFGFFCRVHGASKMSGTVTVSSPAPPPPAPVPPTASFLASANTVPMGETVTFDAGASTAGSGKSITGYAWDLDGNGTFEVSTGTTPSASTTFSTLATVTVGLRVTDSAGLMATTMRAVTVTALPVVIPETKTETSVQTQQATPPAPPAPIVAPIVPSLTGAGSQRVLKAKAISVRAQCGGACSAAVSGKIAIGGSSITLPGLVRQLAAGETAPLALKIPAAALAKIKAALAKKKKVIATISLSAGGGVSTVKVSLKS
jgi:plastocyanin